MCPACRDKDTALRDQARIIAEAYIVDGRPWWETTRAKVVVQYHDFALFERETPIALEHGWEIGQTDTADGHVNVGRIVALGALSLLTPLRSKGSITVTWQRAGVVNAEAPGDPVTTLRQLKDLLDLQLVTQTEYDAKKAEVLARM